MAIRSKLGRGLDVLIPNRSQPVPSLKSKDILSLPLDDIAPNPYQPRRAFDPEDIAHLAASLRRDGVLQPILVRRIQSGYQLISGERRLRAAREAQLAVIPAVVMDADDRKVHEIALIENLQRQDLNPLEQAEGLHALISDPVRHGLATGALTPGHAKVLLSLPDPDAQLQLFHRIQAEALSVRALEELVNTEGPAPPSPPDDRKKGELDPEIAALQDEFTRLLGTKVTINHRNGKGTIRVHYFSPEDFERLHELFRAVQPVA